MLHGVVTAKEFVAAVNEVHSHAAYDALRYVIDDLSQISAFDVSKEVIFDVFAASVGAGMVNPNRRIYVVVTHEGVLSHLNLVQEMYAGALPIQHYPTLDDARKAIAEAARDPQLTSRFK